MPTVYETAERVKSAVFHLALNRARAAVKRELQARGERLAEYSARELTLRAEQYLAQNREALLASAMAAVEQWTADGFFGPSETGRVFVKLCQ
jgi:hypothetical protein